MSKTNRKKHNRKSIWISEENMARDLEFLENMAPSEIKTSVTSLIAKGFLVSRINPTTGKREVQMKKIYGKSEAE